MVSIRASLPSCRRLNSQSSQKQFQRKFFYVAEVNQRRCLEKSGQWLENVDQTHLVLGSGKLLLQKVVHFSSRFVKKVHHYSSDIVHAHCCCTAKNWVKYRGKNLNVRPLGNLGAAAMGSVNVAPQRQEFESPQMVVVQHRPEQTF